LNKELKTELDTALDKLPDIYKTVFILRDIEGLSTREASKVLDITENNVKVRLKRARNYLRDELCTYFENCKSA
jgi:RNA polymerase sigma-70 factor (ECF subfamily)